MKRILLATCAVALELGVLRTLCGLLIATPAVAVEWSGQHQQAEILCDHIRDATLGCEVDHDRKHIGYILQDVSTEVAMGLDARMCGTVAEMIYREVGAVFDGWKLSLFSQDRGMLMGTCDLS